MEDLKLFEILLVEDSETDGELALRALKQHNLVNNVVWVKDGQEALDFVFRRGQYASYKSDNPHMILLDLKLPKVDGINVLRALKNDDRTKNIPVVVLTASAKEQDVTESYRLGVNSYLVKPVEFLDFAGVVAQAGYYWALLNRDPT
jgi:two-component system, response regulator